MFAWKFGGGSSKLGSVGAPALRVFKGCGIVSASSAPVPVPGGGTARAASLTDVSFVDSRGKTSDSPTEGIAVVAATGILSCGNDTLSLQISQYRLPASSRRGKIPTRVSGYARNRTVLDRVSDNNEEVEFEERASSRISRSRIPFVSETSQQLNTDGQMSRSLETRKPHAIQGE